MSKPMTKTQLIATLADEMGSDKKSAGAALDAICSIITKEVSGGGAVTLPGIGKISCRARPERGWLLLAAVQRGQRVVLLTGAAGFVGFHTALQLHSEGDVVLGLDNFNHYYDVRLKRTREANLKAAGMQTLFEGDVCDGHLLKKLLREVDDLSLIHI